MTRFVASVAGLTEAADPALLDGALLSAVFDLLGARCATVWRVGEDQGVPIVQAKARRCATEEAGADKAMPLNDVPHLAVALETGHHSQTIGDGLTAHGFRVEKGPNASILDLHVEQPLSLYQRRLVDGMLQVHRNYAKALEAGLRDQLTGLLNRRNFDEIFLHHNGQRQRLERRRTQQSGHSWLAVLDIDHFKTINDTFGHLYGDEVLVLLARLLTKVFRETDRIFRFGGEEFVIVISDVAGEAIPAVLERCRSAIECTSFPQVGQVTVSIGYTRIRDDDSGAASFGRADKALYAAKQTGRNRVCSFEVLCASGDLRELPAAQGDCELF